MWPVWKTRKTFSRNGSNKLQFSNFPRVNLCVTRISIEMYLDICLDNRGISSTPTHKKGFSASTPCIQTEPAHSYGLCTQSRKMQALHCSPTPLHVTYPLAPPSMSSYLREETPIHHLDRLYFAVAAAEWNERAEE